MLDSKWLEILRTAGPKTTAVAVACGLFLLVAHSGWIDPLDAWVVQLVTFVLLLTGALAVASMASAANSFFRPRLGRWATIRRENRAVRDYIKHMTENEREIIAYLLAKNQKMFTCDVDGGHASTLLSRGIVRIAAKSGQQVVDMMDVPMAIPDHIWDVLEEHRAEFPYTPPRRGEVETHPWRVHWMAR